MPQRRPGNPHGIQFEDIQNARRRVVQGLRLRKGMGSVVMSQWMAVQILKFGPDDERVNGCVNPDTQEAWSSATLAKDIVYLRRQWRAEFEADKIVLLSEHMAGLRMLRGDAWDQNDLSTVLRSFKQEAELMGLDISLVPQEQSAAPIAARAVDYRQASAPALSDAGDAGDETDDIGEELEG